MVDGRRDPRAARAAGAEEADRRPGHPERRSIGFFAICLGYFAIILDGSVLNVAIPAIRRDLGGSLATAQWVLNGYTLTLTALLLTAGVLGDRIGLRRTLLGGVLVFTGASALCAVAPDAAALIAARVVQGVGAAALLPATLALIPHLFPDAGERARATVVWVAVGAISVALGPLVGGLLIDAFGWRSIFLINLPVGVAAAALARWSVPETPRRATPVDRLGQCTAAAALALLTVGLIRGGEVGWDAPSTLVPLALAVVAGAVFHRAERRGAHPILPPAFLAQPLRATAVASAGLMGFLFYGTLFVMSLYFQQLRGWSPGSTGFALLPMTVGSTVGPLAFYRPLAARYGHPAMLLGGFCCCAAGVATLTAAGPDARYPLLALGLLLVGVASTMVFSALTSLLMAATSDRQAGLASGMQNTTRQGGALIAVSVLGALLNSGTLSAASLRGALPAAFTVLVVAVALGVTVAVLAVRAAARAARAAA
ncbi:MFS transporter [Actinacidiphila yeochonensis]|uniref:MFS transporter n=1 Tax=Actinacidiphila yeochonensis TaxID=89050 RepID=UPI000691F59F|nr:MFS transporter [Actinacidiphila yeochonensis]